MEPVGSAAAFVARYAQSPSVDPVAAEILAQLDAEARAAIDARAQPAQERGRWLTEHTGESWSAARLAHVELRAFVAIRRALQRRGLWRN